MEHIISDYLSKERRDMVLLTALLAIAIGGAIPTAHISPLFLLLLPLFVVCFAVRVHRRALEGVQAIASRPEEWKVRMEEEYAAEHLSCKAAYGEIHLLDSCLVCRHKRRLLLLPMDRLVSVRKNHRLVGIKSVPVLYLAFAGTNSVKLDFSARHPEDGETVYAWLAARAGDNYMDGALK